MSFGNELKDFVQGFQSGYDWMDKRAERKLDREERAEEKQYRRGRDSKADERWQTQFDYGVGRDAVNDSWRASDREHAWEQQDVANARADRQEERYTRNDEWTREQAGEANRRADEAGDRADRAQDWRERQDLLKLQTGVGALPEDYVPEVPTGGEAIPATGEGETETEGNAGNDRLSNPLLQRSSWTPGGGTEFKASSGQRTNRGTMGMSGPDIAKAMVYDLQRDLGLPQEASIGLVGQLAGETGGFKHHQELNPVVKGSRGGAGYSQWTGPRRRQFEAFARDHGLDPRSYEANYGFLRYELTRTGEGRILDKIANVRDPIQAGRLFTGSEASRSGFLRPRHVNTAGRDRWTNRVAGLFGGGQRQVRAARGGMIEEQPAPMFGEDDPLGNEYEGQDYLEGNAGDDDLSPVPTPTPAPRGAIPDPDYEGAEVTDDTDTNAKPGVQTAVRAGEDAVRDGLTHIVKTNGVDQQRAIRDEQMDKIQGDILKGYGAAPAGMMRRIADMIDPEKKMNPAQRNLAAMGNVYNYFMDRGDVDKAKEAAASMIQYHQQAFNQFTALAQAAVQDGRVDDATKAALAAYTNIPDGRDLSIEKGEDGKLTITFTDAESGEEMEQAVMDPTQFAERIMKFNPGTFMDSILQAAGQKKQTFDTMDPEKRAEYDGLTRGAVQDRAGEDSQFSTDQLDIIGDVATNIGAFGDNKLNPDQAARLALKLASAEAKKGEDGEWVIEEGGKSIATKAPNSDGMYQVKLGGRTILVDTGTLEDLQGVKGARRAAAVEAATTGQAQDERSAANMGTAMEGFNTFIDASRKALSPNPDNVAEREATQAENFDVIGGAISDAAGAVGEAVAPAVDLVRPSQGGAQVLLDEKRRILASPDASDPARQAQVRRIDAQLRRLGYDPAAEQGGAIPE